MRRSIARLCFAVALMPVAAAAEESPVNISWVEGKDLRLYYKNYLSYLEPHVVRTFTNSLAWQKRMFGWVPSESTIILLEDFADNGGANTDPRGAIVVSVAPKANAFETVPATELMYNLMNHEMVHVVQSDIANEQDRRWRKFFLGKVAADGRNPETIFYSYLTMPRFTTPRWFAEGTAVFFETWMGGGLGRAQGGYDEMVFRAMVRDDIPFYEPLGVSSRASKVDFQTEANAYLYGTRFITWLAYAHSPEKVVAWLRRDEDSRRYYTDQFEQLYGMSLESAWRNWVEFEHEFQRKNLAEVRKFPITPHRQLAGSAVGSISRMHYDDKTGIIYAAYRYPGVVEHVGALNTRDGSFRRIVDIKGAQHYKVASFAFDPASGTAFYTNNNYGLRDLMAVDVGSGEARLLIEHGRIGDLAFNRSDRSLLGVRLENGRATLVRLVPPYNDWKELYEFPYGSVPHDLDISPDGRLLSASVGEINGDHLLRVWELRRVLSGDLKPISEYSFGQSVPENFVFSRDSRYLYGSSYYTGVSNIFRYEVATGDVEAVSNAEVGFFRPVPLDDGRMVILNYTGHGFVPATIEPRPLKDVSAISFLGTELVDKYPIIKTWQVEPPSTVDDEKVVAQKGPYIPLQSVGLANAFPVVQGYKNSVGFGYHANFEDPLQYANVGITAAYTPDQGLPHNERTHLSLDARYRFWRAALSWNRSDFYDIFGPTKRSRKGYAAKLGYDWLLIYDEPRRLEALFDVAWYDQIDTLPTAQNVETPFTRLLTSSIALKYTDVRRSIGAAEDEKGLVWSLVYTGQQTQGHTNPQLLGTFAFGVPLPWPNSSIWSWTAAGLADGAHNLTLANFYFGGFGNNYVDDKSIKRYREYYSLPGFEIDEVSGLRFVKELVELNAPPYVFESAGTPGLYLNWLRASVFAAGLWTEPGNGISPKNFASVGAQVDLRFSLLHWYGMTLSVGYGAGFQGGRKAGTEWMVSLKIM